MLVFYCKERMLYNKNYIKSLRKEKKITGSLLLQNKKLIPIILCLNDNYIKFINKFLFHKIIVIYKNLKLVGLIKEIQYSPINNAINNIDINVIW